MIRVLQLSDSHLSGRASRLRPNFDAVAGHARAGPYDAIVHTGDLTLDGMRYEDDFLYSREALATIGKPVLCVPGNHDVGNHPAIARNAASEAGTAISAARLARYRACMGMDYWTHDLAGWRLIGLDSMLCGSGLAGERAQYAWLHEVLDTAGDRRLAVFIHQPVFIDDPAESALTYWCVDPAVRAWFQPLISHPNLRLIASGHLHMRRSARYGSTALEWCSSTAFVAGPSLVPEMGGDRTVGCVEHLLHADAVESRTVAPAGMENALVDEFIHEIYPQG